MEIYVLYIKYSLIPNRDKTNFPVFAVGSGYHAQLVRGGRRGAPSFSITRQQLLFLRSCGFNVPQMAGVLNVSERTVQRRLRQVAKSCLICFCSVIM